MKNRTACFSGHRKIPNDQYPVIWKNLLTVITDLIQKGYRYFGSGGAIGFDIMAAQAILTLKPFYPHIRLILVLPCITQSIKWTEHDRIIYEHLLARADKIVYTSRDYSQDCMLKRNRHLVDHSSICICYLTGITGGTAYTTDYAKHRGLKIINIARTAETASLK